MSERANTTGTLVLAALVLAMVFVLSAVTMSLDAAEVITLRITPHPPAKDGTVLVIGATPYAEQRCVVSANTCVVTMNVAPDFALNGNITIRESTDASPGNFFGWMQLTTGAQSAPKKTRAVRKKA